MRRSSVILVSLLFVACHQSPATATTDAAPASGASAEGKPEPQVETVTLIVSDGATRLGSFVLAPGAPGVLTLDRTDGRAQKLKATCDEINRASTVSVDVEERPSSGRYVMESRRARRGTREYPGMVQMKLVSEGFVVSR